MIAASASQSSPPTVSVTGRGRREVRPDRVEFHFTLNTLSPSVLEAESALQHQRQALMAALAQSRNSSARLTADGPLITPHHDYERQRHVFKGFKALERLVLRAPLEPGYANDVLHAVAGQLDTLSLDVRFVARKTSAALRSARAEAVRDARRQATHFAEAAGHQLGRLLHLSDTAPSSGSGQGERHENMLYSAAAEAPVEIAPESRAITAEIHAVWELIPA